MFDSNLALISGITLSSGAVSLTDAQADAAFAALGKLPADSLTVTGVPVAAVANIASLGAVLAGMTVQDTAAAVQNDLASGSALETNASAITGISLSGGQVTLTGAQADNVPDVLDKLPGGSLVVTGVAVADIATIAAASSLDHMTVSDSTANIVNDLTGGGVIAGEQRDHHRGRGR